MRKLSVIGIAIACLLTLSGSSCDPKKTIINMERIPKQYRDCFEQVTGPLPKTVTLKVLIDYTAKYRADVLRLRGCGRNTIKWSDHQIDIYSRMGK